MFTTVCRFNHQPEALIAQAILNDNGIVSMIRQKNSLQQSFFSDEPGFGLEVNAADAEEAKSILTQSGYSCE